MRKDPGADTPRRAKSGGRPKELAGLLPVLEVLEDADNDNGPCRVVCVAQVVDDRRSRGLARIGEDGFELGVLGLFALFLTRLTGVTNAGGGGGGSVEEAQLSLQDAGCQATVCVGQDSIHSAFFSSILGLLSLLLLLLATLLTLLQEPLLHDSASP
jgi:hypothetical protein